MKFNWNPFKKRGRPLFPGLPDWMQQTFQRQKEYADGAAERLGENPAMIRNLSASPHEEAIKGGFAVQLAEISRRLGEQVGRLATVIQKKAVDIREAEKERDERLEELAREHGHEVDALDAGHAAREKRIEEVRRGHVGEAAEREKEMEKVREQGGIPKGRPPFRNPLRWIGLVADLVMVVGEYFANKQMISMLLREDGLASSLFAAGLSVGVIWFAHQLGSYAAKLARKEWSRMLALLKGGLALFSAAIALGVLRSLLVGGTLDVEGDPWSKWSVVAVIAFLPTAAFYLAFIAHDGLADLKKTYNFLWGRLAWLRKRVLRLAAELAKAREKHGKEQGRLKVKHQQQRRRILEDARRKRERAFAELAEACRKLNVALAERQTTHNAVSAATLEVVNGFRAKLVELLKEDDKPVPAWLYAAIHPPVDPDFRLVQPGAVIGQDEVPLPLSPVPSAKGKAGPGPLLPMLALLLGMLWTLPSCGTAGQDGKGRVAVEVLVDRTDTAIVRTPAVTAKDLVGITGLGDDNGRPVVEVAVAELGESAFQHRRTVALGGRGRENEYNNRDSVAVFQRDIEALLAHAYRPVPAQARRSRVYIGICEALHRLTAGRADRRILVVHSDYLEHGEVSFYRDRDLVSGNPTLLESRLGEECELPDLKGVQVVLLASTTEGNDALIVPARAFFRTVLEHRGATVSHSFTLQRP